MHYYNIIAMRGKELKNMPDGVFPITLPDCVTSTESFGTSKRYGRYQSKQTCRESVFYRIKEMKSIFSSTSDCILGIQSTGQQYSTVAAILEKYSSMYSKDFVKEVLSKLFKLVFDVQLDINYAVVPAEDIYKIYGGGLYHFIARNHKSVGKNSDGYVTIYLDCTKNTKAGKLGTSVSAILAILREPIIVDKIVSGKIRTATTLSSELLKISAKRTKGDICEYFNIADYGDGNTEKYLTESEQRYLMQSINGDGSDWFSIFLLAGYCQYNKVISGDMAINRNGPVNTMLSAKDELEKFVGKARKLLSMKAIAKRCGNIDEQKDSSIYHSYLRRVHEAYEKVS